MSRLPYSGKGKTDYQTAQGTQNGARAAKRAAALITRIADNSAVGIIWPVAVQKRYHLASYVWRFCL